MAKRQPQIDQDEHFETANAKRSLMVGQDDLGNFVIISVNTDGALDVDVSSTPMNPHFDPDGDNTVQDIKTSAGTLHMLELSNSNTADAFIQLFDEAGAITVGTTTPKLSLLIPKKGAMDKSWPTGIDFANSIKYACTTTATGSGNPTTGLVVNGGFI